MRLAAARHGIFARNAKRPANREDNPVRQTHEIAVNGHVVAVKLNDPEDQVLIDLIRFA